TSKIWCIISLLRWTSQYGGIAQLGERLHGMQEVSGSIPLTSTSLSEESCRNSSKRAFYMLQCAACFVRSPSSRGLGHHPFTVGTGVRIPLGTPGFFLVSVVNRCGAVVQLVRIPACHAGGRGFESRPLRQRIQSLVVER